MSTLPHHLLTWTPSAAHETESADSAVTKKADSVSLTTKFESETDLTLLPAPGLAEREHVSAVEERSNPVIPSSSEMKAIEEAEQIERSSVDELESADGEKQRDFSDGKIKSNDRERKSSGDVVFEPSFKKQRPGTNSVLVVLVSSLFPGDFSEWFVSPLAFY